MTKINSAKGPSLVNNTPPLKPAWRNLFLRAQSATRNHDGIQFLQLQVIVKDGNPLFWAEPKIVKIEPKLDISLEMLLSHLDEESLGNLLNALM